MSNGVDENSPMWNYDLYKFQSEAPTPKALLRSDDIKFDHSTIDFYGYEYHGEIDHKKSDALLDGKCDGTYLVRRSANATDFFTLSFRFNNKTKNYKIFYNPKDGHYLNRNRRYDTLHDLVADGLVKNYIETHAAPIIQSMASKVKSDFEQSPYMTLNRRRLRDLSKNKPRKALKCNLPLNIEVESAAQSLAAASLSNIVDAKKLIEDNATNLNANTPSQGTSGTELFDAYYQPHKFKVHNFIGLNWCDFCKNFLWGFTAQGVKCENCDAVSHNKCAEVAPPKCVLKNERGVFGLDLTTVVTRYNCKIPYVVTRCVEEVEARGMLQEGIYRISGFADEIEDLKLALDKDKDKTDMSVFSNINVIAGTLKMYLRLLPIPLVTYQVHPAFIQAPSCATFDEQISKMREAVVQLPTAHYDCLKFVIEHLNRVSSHHAANKMTEHNIAVVFAPTLVAIPQHMTDLSQEIIALALLINHCQAVFSN